MAIRGNNALIINPYILPNSGTKNNYYKFTGWLQAGDYDDAWQAAYNKFLSMSWGSGVADPFLLCWGAAEKLSPNYQAKIEIMKNALIYKPKDYMTQEEWDEVISLQLKIPREKFRDTDEEGGALKCIETGEIVEQIFGDNIFTISKSIANYNEFYLTIEGLCRNTNDLKPPIPPQDESRRRGAYSPKITNSTLYYI